MDFKDFCHQDKKLQEFRLFQGDPASDPDKWTQAKRVCMYCDQPVKNMGTYSDMVATWSKCDNPKCDSQQKSRGLLDPKETKPAPSRISKWFGNVKNAAAAAIF